MGIDTKMLVHSIEKGDTICSVELFWEAEKHLATVGMRGYFVSVY